MGRLIDEDNIKYHSSARSDAYVYRSDINRIPSADVVARSQYDMLYDENIELRKQLTNVGVWKQVKSPDGYTSTYICSACNCYVPHKYRYCHSCGAKMYFNEETIKEA